MFQQKLIIKNFGPIKDLELEIPQFLVLIGPQASGKSTVSKAIYFFRSLDLDFANYILGVLEETGTKSLEKIIRQKFLEVWGTTSHLYDFTLEYYYQEGIFIQINQAKNTKYIETNFSKDFLEEINGIIDYILSQDKESKLTPNFPIKNFVTKGPNEELKRYSYLSIFRLLNGFNVSVFIPAGRSLISTLADELFVDKSNLDGLMQGFVNEISENKKYFNKSLSEIVEEKEYLTDLKIDKERVAFAEEIINTILKGKYRQEGREQRLYIDDEKYVKLNYASSGQQEAIWILNLLFMEILEKRQTFLFVEEPEAHLYPEAQKSIIDLMALFYNTTPENQMVITTHSPYILASLNNLLYAAKVGKDKPKEIAEIIDKRLWLKLENFKAFFVQDGRLENIIDEELGLIQNEALDSASRIINQAFDQIYEQED